MKSIRNLIDSTLLLSECNADNKSSIQMVVLWKSISSAISPAKKIFFHNKISHLIEETVIVTNESEISFPILFFDVLYSMFIYHSFFFKYKVFKNRIANAMTNLYMKMAAVR